MSLLNSKNPQIFYSPQNQESITMFQSANKKSSEQQLDKVLKQDSNLQGSSSKQRYMHELSKGKYKAVDFYNSRTLTRIPSSERERSEIDSQSDVFSRNPSSSHFQFGKLSLNQSKASYIQQSNTKNKNKNLNSAHSTSIIFNIQSQIKSRNKIESGHISSNISSSKNLQPNLSTYALSNNQQEEDEQQQYQQLPSLNQQKLYKQMVKDNQFQFPKLYLSLKNIQQNTGSRKNSNCLSVIDTSINGQLQASLQQINYKDEQDNDSQIYKQSQNKSITYSSNPEYLQQKQSLPGIDDSYKNIQSSSVDIRQSKQLNRRNLSIKNESHKISKSMFDIDRYLKELDKNRNLDRRNEITWKQCFEEINIRPHEEPKMVSNWQELFNSKKKKIDSLEPTKAQKKHKININLEQKFLNNRDIQQKTQSKRTSDHTNIQLQNSHLDLSRDGILEQLQIQSPNNYKVIESKTPKNSTLSLAIPKQYQRHSVQLSSNSGFQTIPTAKNQKMNQQNQNQVKFEFGNAQNIFDQKKENNNKQKKIYSQNRDLNILNRENKQGRNQLFQRKPKELRGTMVKQSMIKKINEAKGISYQDQKFIQNSKQLAKFETVDYQDKFDQLLKIISENFIQIYNLNLSKKALFHLIKGFLKSKGYIATPFLDFQKQKLNYPPSDSELRTYFLQPETLQHVQIKWTKFLDNTKDYENEEQKHAYYESMKGQFDKNFAIQYIYNPDLQFFNQLLNEYLLNKNQESLQSIVENIITFEKKIEDKEKNFLSQYIQKSFLTKFTTEISYQKDDLFYQILQNRKKTKGLGQVEHKFGDFNYVDSKQRIESVQIEQSIDYLKEHDFKKQSNRPFQKFYGERKYKC